MALNQQPKPTLKPPKNIEEFLSASRLKDWPPPAEMTTSNLQLFPEQVINKNAIFTKLLQAAPLSMAGFGMLRKNIEVLNGQVAGMASHFIQKKDLAPVSQEKKSFYAPPQTFLTEVAESEIVRSLAGVKKTARARSAGQELVRQDDPSTNNVLKANFPGIKPDAATDLPNWIELPGIVEKVAQTVEVQPNLRPLWRQIYLSQGSIVLIQDGFWYLFLDYFKQPEDEIVTAKDKFFDRMADTYAILFFSVDRSVRDRFFQDYTTIVAQSIFLCFADAFPDSQYLYDDAFKAYIANCVALWFQGVKPVPGVYKKWAVNSMLKADQIEAERKARQANMHFDPASLDAALAQVSSGGTNSTVPVIAPRKQQPVRMSISPTNPTVLRQQSQAVPVSTVPSKAPKSATGMKPPKESLPIGPGAQIERVKFRLQGNSQLLDHLMRMHGISVRPGPVAVRSQEVAAPPLTTQTYADLVRESKKAMKEFDRKMAELESQASDEVARVHKQYAAECQKRRTETGSTLEGMRAQRESDIAMSASQEVREMMKVSLQRSSSDLLSRPRSDFCTKYDEENYYYD